VAQAERVRAVVTPDDPLGWLTREPDGVVERERWMLRIVDAAAAIAGRGFPATAELAVTLHLDDATRPGHAGRWTLEVGGGQGSLHPAVTHPPAPESPAGPLRLGARGFAALYAGIPLATLRRAGLAAGGDASADDALDSAFAGQAFMLDDF
jgi:predicted acetyltransferase